MELSMKQDSMFKWTIRVAIAGGAVLSLVGCGTTPVAATRATVGAAQGVSSASTTSPPSATTVGPEVNIEFGGNKIAVTGSCVDATAASGSLHVCDTGKPADSSETSAGTTSPSSVPPSAPATSVTSIATAQPAAPSSPVSSNSQAGIASCLPAGFPVPPSSTIVSCVADAGEFVAELRVVSTRAANEFYLAALPAAGYTVKVNSGELVTGGFDGKLDFFGNGFRSEAGTLMAFDTSTSIVSIVLVR
jgi:hypothetical protein